ncbi:MAG: Asp-tRNA(Asn)/Glu-tRNA(Gln) amidotransferase subunit GatB [Candidatus Electrothrix sp. AW2]|nr:Asp-tRNA(Asn)/Glu-tRNA(Gln) amidotransferase subunit GatB [Candidatus Electrothrix gigas]
MQEGSFRCDANISLRPKGQEKLGTRTELKNMNSFRNVQLALEYEERRQRDVLLDGGEVIQSTLLWNPDTGKTESMRGKEEAHDYRYFPDPDLVPIHIDEDWIERVQGELPELAGERKQRFMDDMGLPEDVAATLTSSRDLADFFEQVYTEYKNPKKVSNFITTELLREYSPEQINECPVTATQLAALLQMVEKNTISGKIAKTVFADMLVSGDDPEKIVKDKGLVQMSDEGELVAIVREIIAANPDQAQQFRDGKTKVMGFFVGQLMQKTKGKANPQLANTLFGQELNNS